MKDGGVRKILVTGAAGFIGAALCGRLALLGYKVHAIDNLNDYYDVNLKLGRLAGLGISDSTSDPGDHKVESTKFPNLSFEKQDITDRNAMESIFDSFRPEVVVHLAAQAGVRYSIENPYSYSRNNVNGFLVMLECARNYPVQRLVYASSSSVYGKNRKVPFSECDGVEEPVSLYAATKRSNELMARAYRNLYGIPAIGLRFFTVYGPWGRPDMAPMLFAKAISCGNPIRVFNHGDMSRDFTFIEDIIDGIVKVVEGRGPVTSHNDILNIGKGSPANLMEFISLLEEAMGTPVSKEYLPMQQGDVPVTFADTSRLESLYDYKPSTSLKEGVEKFVKWFKDYYKC